MVYIFIYFFLILKKWNKLKYFNISKRRALHIATYIALSLIAFRAVNALQNHYKKASTYRKAPYLPDESRLIETPLKYFNRARRPVLISFRPFVPAEAWLRLAKGCSSRIREGGPWHTTHFEYRGGRWRTAMRERNGRKRRTRKEDWRSPRENQRARTGGDENQGTSVPSSSHARNLQLPPTEEDIHTRCSWGPGSIAGKPKSESERNPRKSASLRLGNAGHEGSQQMRAVGQESKYYDRVALRGPVPLWPSLVTLCARVNGARVVPAAPL